MIIGAIVGLIGTIATTAMATNRAEQSQQNEFGQQERMLSLQNQFSEDMWQKNNDYNDANSQMVRGLLAGISPNALAQGISNSPGFGQQVVSSQSNSVNPLGGVLGSLIQGAGSSINSTMVSGLDSLFKLRQQNSELELNENLARLYGSQDLKTQADTFYQNVLNKYVDEQQSAILQNLLKDGRIKESTAQMLEQDAAIHEQLNELNIEQFSAQNKILKQQFTNLLQELNNLKATERNIEQNTRESAARTLTEGKKQSNYDALTKYQSLINDIFAATGIDPTKEPIYAKTFEILLGSVEDQKSDDYWDFEDSRIAQAKEFLDDLEVIMSYQERVKADAQNGVYTGETGNYIKFLGKAFESMFGGDDAEVSPRYRHPKEFTPGMQRH